MDKTFPLVKRDISWLSFNGRVLQEAANPQVPLYERLKFLAIYSSNLDEFYRVRVASHRSFRKLKKETRKEMEIQPKKILKEIRSIVGQQQSEFGRIFWKEIIPALQEHGIYLINDEQYSAAQRVFAREWYEENVKQKINILSLDEHSETPPFLENKELYFVVQFEGADTPLSLVNIPSDQLDRFILFPPEQGNHAITFLDDIIRCNFDRLFPDQVIAGVYAVKVSRDAEIYIDDEFDGDLVEKIKSGLDERNIGLPTRFLYDNQIPPELLARLKTLLNLSKNDLIPGGRYHNFNDFFGFPDPVGLKELYDREMPPLPHPELEECTSLMEAITGKDYMLHFPYQKYDYIPQLLREAADDEQVRSIRITLYRVAEKSAIAQCLVYALEKGKSVSVFIEAKARFDEKSNLYWGEKLKEAGAKVQYSYPGIKVHTKLLQIQRKEGEDSSYYTYIGTGNFNEKTAKLYGDHALLTADQAIGRDVSQVFDLLGGRIILPKCKHLFVSPFTTRKNFVKLIDKEIENARSGKTAYMILKMNSLEDSAMIRKLYEASNAGVKIQLIVRGICCLVAGQAGYSENIEVISIVDRFLEHARIYLFANGGNEKMYTASADWMGRNLDRRVEVAIPILAPEVFEELRKIIDVQLADNTKARIIDAGQSNHYVSREGKEKIRSQQYIYTMLKNKVLV